MTLSDGTKVRVLSGRGSSFEPGTIGTIVTEGYDEPGYYRVERESDNIRQWICVDDVTHADPSQITDLETFKRAVVVEAMRSKKDHNWCSEAEEVLRRVGCGDYLPVEVSFTVTATVTVLVDPTLNLTPREVQRRAEQSVTFTDDVSGWVNNATKID